MGFIAYHPIYPLPLPEGHRFPMEKYDLLPKQLSYEGSCTEDDFFIPKACSMEHAKRVHAAAYVDRLARGELSKKKFEKLAFHSPKPLSNGNLSLQAEPSKGQK